MGLGTQAFNFSSDRRKDALVITTSGYINQKAGDLIAAECIPFIAEGGRRLVIDLAETKLINSIGIATIIDLIERLMQNNGKLLFVNVNPALDKTLSYMGIYQLAKKSESVEKALAE